MVPLSEQTDSRRYVHLPF